MVITPVFLRVDIPRNLFLYILAPSNVENFTVVVESSTIIHVAWDPPIDVKGILSSYFIEWIDGDGEINISNTNETHFNITDLQPHTNYTVEVSLIRFCYILFVVF